MKSPDMEMKEPIRWRGFELQWNEQMGGHRQRRGRFVVVVTECPILGDSESRLWEARISEERGTGFFSVFVAWTAVGAEPHLALDKAAAQWWGEHRENEKVRDAFAEAAAAHRARHDV